ncbi:MAG: FeoB-associated Cys-rich membrane protein [Treponema sp.]|jgi:hypothetical protein|nr:FeoB-associated Cys-rich membrane protein [Treponema sp.]
MEFIRDNLSTIVTAVVVFGILGLILFRLIRRRGQGTCGCGCAGCAAGDAQGIEAEIPQTSPSGEVEELERIARSCRGAPEG